MSDHAPGTRATLFLIIDAGRDDYVRPETMPFLSGLAERSLRGSFVSPPGFAQRTAFFTGRYPDTSGNLSAFVFDPDGSPFRWLKRLGPLPNLVRPYKVFVPARRLIKHVSRWTSDCYHTDPGWIPPRFAPFFRPCEDAKPVHDPGALGATSVFDLARTHRLSYTYRAHPVSGDDDKVFAGLVRDLRRGAPYDFYAAQFSILDQEGHIHGPGSRRIQKECLTILDRKLAAVHAALSAGYRDWNLFVCADHGMAPVERRVNVLAALKRLPIKPARDYVVFVNSTLAVFWYLTEHGRRTIEEALPRIEGATVLSDEERQSRRIPTDRRWGDRMLAAQPGTLFWPDYFHVIDSTIRGMHGYLDKSQERYGMAVLASSDGSTSPGTFAPRPLVDVFPTLCDLLSVPAPASHEGESVLARR
ncbi:MAG TPA: alkaline phosphatase family protein [Candidatus Thermoplasmatota archaeon]|nr:alkaline phosphatase family protein [Candidatus Thermoplasmatota archaeon]